jgi:GntR family transcriptional regulator
MKFRIDHHSSVPVYRQMVEAIAAAIESEELKVGDRLPSIRELSARLKINPNTTAKVYRELELRGFIEGRAGSGCFVRPVDEKAAATAKVARMQELFTQMLGEARASRIKERDFLEFLKARATT